MAEVWIALGSNVGDSLQNLRKAVKCLQESFGPLKVSRIYRTDPMYVEDQPPFLNAAVAGTTVSGPREVLAMLKALEAEMGREARMRNGPREIDLDLIAYGNLAYQFIQGDQLKLVVPHPAVAERRFVLQPLNDIVPNGQIPGVGSVRDLLQRTDDQRESVLALTDALL